MRSMFQVGFEKEVFSDRHPQMGISIADLQSWWKTYYPQAKAGLKPIATQPLPGTVVTSPTNLVTNAPRVAVPASSSGANTALVVGGLAVLGLGAYYLLARRPFGLKK